MSTTAIFGAGVMGETLLSGLIRSGQDVAELVITERRPDRVSELQGRYGVRILDNVAAAEEATTLVLVVKPQDMDTLLQEIHDAVRPGDLVVSLAAGITTAHLLRRQRPQLDVAILEPSANHFYQPGWTLVVGGVMRLEQAQAERTQGRLVVLPVQPAMPLPPLALITLAGQAPRPPLLDAFVPALRAAEARAG